MNKKIISTILSLLVMTSSISVFAYSDCNDESVKSLTELNVLSGYGDDTFKPANLLSRAEFAKMISTATGFSETEEQGEIQEEIQSVFSDVDNTYWALKYINHCKALMIVNGYEDATFRPDNNISFAEVIKVCLSAVGYNQLITEEGDNWYDSWLDLAYEYKLIDTRDIDANKKISRVEMAQLLYRTINLPLYQLNGYRVVDGVLTPTFDFADGTVDKNGNEKPLKTLLTMYLQ